MSCSTYFEIQISVGGELFNFSMWCDALRLSGFCNVVTCPRCQELPRIIASRVETHLRRRRLPVCVVGSQVHESQALRGGSLWEGVCSLLWRVSITPLPLTLPSTQSSHLLWAQVERWLTSRLVNAEVLSKSCTQDGRGFWRMKGKALFYSSFWHHSYIRY